MAKVQNPALSLLASGSIGGVTFGRNRYGSWARERVTPQQPDSEKQLSQRQIMIDAAAWYNTLTQQQQQQWYDAAFSFSSADSLGKRQTLEGRQLAMRQAMTALRLGREPVSTPVAPFSPTYFPTITLNNRFFGITATLDPTPANNSGVIFQVSPPQKTTRRTCPAQLTFIAAANDLSESEIILIDSADMAEGLNRYWFRIKPVGRDFWPSPIFFDYIDASQNTEGLAGIVEPAIWGNSNLIDDLWQDVGKTTPVTADGQPIGRMKNQRGTIEWLLT
jgi:hypothetical protein